MGVNGCLRAHGLSSKQDVWATGPALLRTCCLDGDVWASWAFTHPTPATVPGL